MESRTLNQDAALHSPDLFVVLQLFHFQTLSWSSTIALLAAQVLATSRKHDLQFVQQLLQLCHGLSGFVVVCPRAKVLIWPYLSFI